MYASAKPFCFFNGNGLYQIMENLKQINFKTCIRLLQESVPSKSLTDIRQAHGHLVSNGYLDSDVFLWNRLIDKYVKCGSLVDACHVFDKMPERDIASWTSLITGYTKRGYIETARQLFDQMPIRNVESWTALISGYGQHGRSEDVLKLFSQMVLSDIKPNQFTFVSTLRACTGLFALNPGKQVHGYIIKIGLESNVFVSSALLDLYTKCGNIGDARQVFDKMPERDAVSCTTMMVGYTQNQFGEEALKLFSKMQETDMKHDGFSLASALSACGSLAALVPGKMVHAQVIRTGFYLDSVVVNAIVDMYAKCGSIRDAHQMFDRMSERNVVSWTSLIMGYIQNGYNEEAFKLFMELVRTDVKPNPFTLTNVLSACASLALLELGKQLHAHIIGTGFETDLSVENSLVTMYAKCGSIDDAAQVFDKIDSKDLISWNAMIAGYAHNGNGKEALKLFEVMLEEDMKPDQITLLGILSACSHAGLVDEGCHCFDLMRREQNILVTTEHYACMIDLLGRAGRMHEAEDIVNNMPFEPDSVVWKALLCACRIHCNVDVGERAAEHLIQWEPEESSAYILLSNVYAAANRWKDVAKLRNMMKDRGMKTQPGCSWIHVKNSVYIFFAGYVADTSVV